LRLEPPFEVLNANLKFNLGMPDHHRNRGLAASDFIDPIIFPEHAKTLSDCFVKRIRSHIHEMLAAS